MKVVIYRAIFILTLFFTLGARAGVVGDALQSLGNAQSTIIDESEAMWGTGGVCYQNFSRAQQASVDCSLASNSQLNSNPKEAFSRARSLLLHQLARSSDENAKCHIGFFNSYVRNANHPLNQKAYEAFQEIESVLRELNSAKFVKTGQYSYSCQQSPDEVARNTPTDQKRCEQLKQELNDLNLGMDALIARVPFGTDKKLRDKIKELSSGNTPTTQAQFKAAFSDRLKAIHSDLLGFRADLEKITTYVGNNGTVFYNFDKNVKIKKDILSSPNYEQLVKSLELPDIDARTQARTRQALLCDRRSRIETGPSRFAAGMIIGAVVALPFTGGGSAAVLTDLALTTVGASAGISAAARDCYGTSTYVASTSTCSPGATLDGAIAKTSRAQCAVSAIFAASPALVPFLPRIAGAVRRERPTGQIPEARDSEDLIVTARRVETKVRPPSPLNPQMMSLVRQRAESAPRRVPYDDPMHVRGEFEEAILNATPQQKTGLREIRSKLTDRQAWSDYLDELARETLVSMAASPYKEIRDLAARGVVRRNDMLKTLVARGKARNDSAFTTITVRQGALSEEALQKIIPRPFFDKGAGSLTSKDLTHGVDSHILQRDFIATTSAARNYPGGTQGFYSSIGTQEGYPIFRTLIDGAEARNGTNPGYVTKLIEEAGLSTVLPKPIRPTKPRKN